MAMNRDAMQIYMMLMADIPDWDMVHPEVQDNICEWIAEDRRQRGGDDP